MVGMTIVITNEEEIYKNPRIIVVNPAELITAYKKTEILKEIH